jgi:hypothetical protein
MSDQKEIALDVHLRTGKIRRFTAKDVEAVLDAALASEFKLAAMTKERDEAKATSLQMAECAARGFRDQRDEALKRADAAEATLAKVTAERNRMAALVRNAEPAYCGGAVFSEVIGFLEAAGCGKPGTPNTVWAMTQEIIARSIAAEKERDEARGMYTASDERRAKAAQELDSLGKALQWVVGNYKATLAGKSVRDADECLACARAALAKLGMEQS